MRVVMRPRYVPSSFVTTSARTLCWRSRRPASSKVASWPMEMGSGVMTSDTRAYTLAMMSGGGDAVPLEDPGGLRRQGAEADGTVDAGRLFGILRPAGKLVLQIRVAHRCADRIVVRVLMAHDDDRCRHCCTPYPRALTRGAPLTLQSCGCSLRPRCGAARLPRTPSIAGRAKRVSPDQPFRAQMSRKSQKAPARDGRTRP